MRGEPSVLHAALLAPLIVEQKPPVSVFPEHPPVLAVPYAGAGSMELGAWVGGAASSDSLSAQAGGSVGWFFAKGFELSGLAGAAYLHPAAAELEGRLLVEPSVHVAFGATVLGFTGLGAGATLSSSGFGFALSQRVGVNVVLGRGALLTPALTLSYDANAPQTTAVGATLGYSATW